MLAAGQELKPDRILILSSAVCFIIYYISNKLRNLDTSNQEASQMDSNFRTDSPLSGKHDRIGSKRTCNQSFNNLYFSIFHKIQALHQYFMLAVLFNLFRSLVDWSAILSEGCKTGTKGECDHHTLDQGSNLHSRSKIIEDLDFNFPLQ